MANPNPRHVNIVNPACVDITYPGPNHADAIANPDDVNIVNPARVDITYPGPNHANNHADAIANPPPPPRPPHVNIAITFAAPVPPPPPPPLVVNNEPNMVHFPADLYKAALGGKIKRDIDYWQNVTTPKGNSILHIHVAVPVDVRPVNIRFLNYVLTQNVQLLHSTNDRDETPLHLAASFGQLKAVRLFMETNPNLLHSENVNRDTALHMAAQNKHTSVVRYLCDRQESSGIINSTNEAGETPLDLGVQSGSEDLVQVIINKINEVGNIPPATSILHAAIIWGNRDMVTRLNYRQLLQSREGHGQTPIHYAAGVDNRVLEAFLITQESHYAVYIKDNQGRTAAHIAAQQNNVDGLKLLMNHFPAICEITDDQGRNIVHYSATLGHLEALDYFLSEIHFSDLVNKKDNGKDTPLHLLVKSLEMLPIPIRSLERLRSLIPKLSKLQVMSYNDVHKTPGDIASSIKFSKLEAERKDALREIRIMAPKGGRVKQWIPPLQEYKEDIEAQPEGYDEYDLGTAAGSHLVVAALIATVSFTAGLSAVPGGFFPEPKKGEGGTAILSHSIAFQAFLYTDCFALVSSLSAIFWNFWFVLTGQKNRHFLTLAFRATPISIYMLMAAFLTGTYSFFQPSQKTAVVFAFLPVITFNISTLINSWKAIPRNQPRWQNNKLKWRVLHGHVTSATTIIAASSTLMKWFKWQVMILFIIIAVEFAIIYFTNKT